jgi:hypothetical protein
MTGNRLWPAAVFATALAACDTGGTVGIIATTTADVRALNASTTSIDLMQDQTIDPANSGIAFGASSLCMTVDLVSHGLSVRPAGIRTTTVPLPSFAADERYVVVVTGTASSLQPLPFRNSFTPAAGKAGMRLVNVSGGTATYDIYVTVPGAALVTANASAIAAGTASSYFNVPITAQQVRLIDTQSGALAFDVGNVTVPAGGKAVVVLASPATGGTTARPFVFQIAPGGSC